MNYDPKTFWEHRLSNSFNLRGVGHMGFGELYNAWLYRRKKRCIESFFGNSTLTGKHVLDVGCGTGFFIQWYLQRGANVCGMDITDTSIQKLKQLYDCEFFIQDVAAPDYQPYRKFDIINMWDVGYHIVEKNAFDQAFDNLSRSLKEGGLLLLTDWFGAVCDARLAEHVQARSIETYLQLLPQKGFELVTVCPLYKTLNKEYRYKIVNYFGWLLFLVDDFSKKIAQDNLSLGVWRYNQDSKQKSDRAA